MTPPRQHGNDRPPSLAAIDPGRSAEVADVLTRLEEDVDRVVGTPVDDLEAARLRDEVAVLTAVRRRIEARTCQAIAALHRHEVAAAQADAPDDPLAPRRASRALDQELREDLRLTPSQLKTARAVGERLASSPELAAAMASGTIGQAHARVLDQTLRPLSLSDRARIEPELVAAACTGLDPVALGRLCRRRLAQVDAEAAEEAEHRRHTRRRASGTQTADGMFALHGQWAGLGGEVIRTAIDAHSRPDAPGERRTSEQRFADAVTAMARASLEGGRGPTNHGVRPHIVVTVDLDTLTGRGDLAPVAEGRWSGPIIWAAVRRILDDSSVSFLAIGNDLPIAVTEEVRTIPAGVWKGVAHRDRTCIHHRCDVPPEWCDVMHLVVPYAKGGRLTFATAALGCSFHHDQYDDGRLELHWHDGRPVLKPPGG